MNNLNIAIPTYQRSNIILCKTLFLLERLKVPRKNIFVVVGCNDDEDMFNDYFDNINSMYPGVNVIVGDNCDALASQLNFIRTELFEDKQLGLILDDDLDDILVRVDEKTLRPITAEEFDTAICISSNLMREHNIGLCGVNSSGNAFYMSDKVKLCKSCICGGFQLCFNEPDLNLSINQGGDAYESCWYLDKYQYNLKIDFLTIKTKLFSPGGLYEYRLNEEQTHNDYLKVAKTYPEYLDYYTWKKGETKGIDNNEKEVKIPVSRRNKLTIELKWKRFPSKQVRKKEDYFLSI
jgi:hypothetical protein